jgi:hypothetical protein
VSEMQSRNAVFLVAIAAVFGTAALLAAVGRATPSSFELAINGFHSAAEPREKFSLGFRHEGPFTASRRSASLDTRWTSCWCLPRPSDG